MKLMHAMNGVKFLTYCICFTEEESGQSRMQIRTY